MILSSYQWQVASLWIEKPFREKDWHSRGVLKANHIRLGSERRGHRVSIELFLRRWQMFGTRVQLLHQ